MKLSFLTLFLFLFPSIAFASVSYSVSSAYVISSVAYVDAQTVYLSGDVKKGGGGGGGQNINVRVTDFASQAENLLKYIIFVLIVLVAFISFAFGYLVVKR